MFLIGLKLRYKFTINCHICCDQQQEISTAAVVNISQR